MADKKNNSKKESVKKNSEPKKKTQTVRERAEGPKTSKKRVRKTVKKATAPIKSVKKLNAKHYHLPLPNNKFGRFLGRKVRFIPRFVVEAFQEVRQVTWPNRTDTIKLTFAVFIFSIFIATFVGVLDYGLSKAFQEFIVNRN